MILVNELRGRMAVKNYTQRKLAKALKISEKTLSLKLKNGVFGSDEIDELINILDIKNPCTIFFAQIVTCEGTNKGEGA